MPTPVESKPFNFTSTEVKNALSKDFGSAFVVTQNSSRFLAKLGEALKKVGLAAQIKCKDGEMVYVPILTLSQKEKLNSIADPQNTSKGTIAHFAIQQVLQDRSGKLKDIVPKRSSAPVPHSRLKFDNISLITKTLQEIGDDFFTHCKGNFHYGIQKQLAFERKCEEFISKNKDISEVDITSAQELIDAQNAWIQTWEPLSKNVPKAETEYLTALKKVLKEASSTQPLAPEKTEEPIPNPVFSEKFASKKTTTYGTILETVIDGQEINQLAIEVSKLKPNSNPYSTFVGLIKGAPQGSKQEKLKNALQALGTNDAKALLAQADAVAVRTRL